MLNREQTIAIARGLGWSIDKVSGKSTEEWTVKNSISGYDLSYPNESLAWDFVVAQITGTNIDTDIGSGIKMFENTIYKTSKYDRLLNEMINYVHPSMKVDAIVGKLRKGNVYAWHERSEGQNPINYSMSIGIEIYTGGNLPFSFYVFREETDSSSNVSREHAIENLYSKFQEWVVTQKADNRLTWSLQQERL